MKTFKRTLAWMLALCLMCGFLPVGVLAATVSAPTANLTTSGSPFQKGTGESTSFRIPALVTLSDGTLVAAADARWNTTFDGGGLDTMVAISQDNGATWTHSFANYLGDNGNVYNGSSSTCFIDPALAVRTAAGTDTIYMLCDLYPYGIALNGSGNTAPSTAVGFTAEGYLKLDYNGQGTYAYYLKDGQIYSAANNGVISNYSVDAYFNITSTAYGVDTNLFYADSPFKVVRTGYLYLTKSTDGGSSWSAPQLLPLKTADEMVCLVGPGRGLVTGDGTIVFPVYSYNGSEASQRLSFLYSTDGTNWARSDSLSYSWASESVAIELDENNLRFFFRNGSANLMYVDYNWNTGWATPQSTGLSVNSNCQISAIRLDQTIGGEPVVLVSCPAGGAGGSNQSGASYRINGKIFLFTLGQNNALTYRKTLSVPSVNSTNNFMYSCMTALTDKNGTETGDIAILYEDKESGWGVDQYYQMSYQTYDVEEAFGVTFSDATGKSQTITNIIAEALADGKKVLFVSEKAAALQVVLKRLADVGLDDFCLSLHDYKANKKEIIDSIGSNLDLEEEYIDSSLISELTALFHDRTFLNAYADELHKEILPLGLSIYEVFGKLLNLSTAPSVEFTVDGLTKITKEQYASIMYCVSAFEKALRNMGGPLRSNPWFGTKATSAGQVYKNALLNKTESLSEYLRKTKEEVESLDRVASTGLTDSYSNAQKLLSFVRLLNTSAAVIRPRWFKPGVLSQAQIECRDAEEHAIKLSNALESIYANWDKSILEVDENAVCVFLRGDYSWLYDKSSGETLENELGAHIESAVNVKASIVDLLKAFHEALALIHYTADDTFENIRMVSKVLALIVEAPYMEASWFDLRKNAELVPIIVQAREHSNIIERITSELLQTWELSALDIDAEGMLSRFKTEYVGLFHKMKANYKEDIKTLRLHAKTVGAKLEEPDIISFLQKVREINTEKAWFSENRDVLERALGHHFHGEKTDWDRVRASMAAALQITDQFPYDSISQDTIEALRRITESLQLSGSARRLAEVLSENAISSLEQRLHECKYVLSNTENQNLTKNIIPEIDAFVEVCTQHSQHISTLLAAKREKSVSYADITELLSLLKILKMFRVMKGILSSLALDMLGPKSSVQTIGQCQ